MKRIKPLSLKTETVRVLSSTELASAVGGAGVIARSTQCTVAGGGAAVTDGSITSEKLFQYGG